MKWPDVTDADLRGALNVVTHAHDPDAAKNLIDYFHERFENELPYNADILLAFVKVAFKRIAEDGWSADHAFGLNRKPRRGRYTREDTTERDVTAAALVILHMRKGWRFLDAVEETAGLIFQAEDRGVPTVRDAYAKYRETFSSFPDETLLSLLPGGTTVIKRDMAG